MVKRIFNLRHDLDDHLVSNLYTDCRVTDSQ